MTHHPNQLEGSRAVFLKQFAHSLWELGVVGTYMWIWADLKNQWIECRTMEIIKAGTGRKKIEEKWPESKEHLGYSKRANVCIVGFSEGKKTEKRKEKIFEKIMTEHFPNFMKYMKHPSLKLQVKWIQETHTKTQDNQTFKSQQRANIDSSKREANHHKGFSIRSSMRFLIWNLEGQKTVGQDKKY